MITREREAQSAAVDAYGMFQQPHQSTHCRTIFRNTLLTADDSCAQPEVESAIRVGDVYALMVEWYYSQQQMDQAYALIEKMRARGIILSPYLDSEMVHTIYSAMGMPAAQDPPSAPQPSYDDAPDEQLPDDIEEDFD